MSTIETLATCLIPAGASTTVVNPDNPAPVIPQVAAGYAEIEQLVHEREAWENTAYRASNDVLYALLQRCYALYKRMEGTSIEAVVLRDSLANYINLRGIKCTRSSHTIVKIVKCVFGDDRRRASAYGIVLRAALAEKLRQEDLPSFIRSRGGVEEIRLAKSTNAMTPKQKAVAAADAVQATSMGVFESQGLATAFDAGKIGTAVVLIGTWQPEGGVVVHSVVQSDTVVNAALASYYSANRTTMLQHAQHRRAANDAQIRRDAVAEAVQVAVRA